MIDDDALSKWRYSYRNQLKPILNPFIEPCVSRDCLELSMPYIDSSDACLFRHGFPFLQCEVRLDSLDSEAGTAAARLQEYYMKEKGSSSLFLLLSSTTFYSFSKPNIHSTQSFYALTHIFHCDSLHKLM